MPARRWAVYMVRCVDRSLYAGSTTDVARRVTQHNVGRGGAYTASHRPVRLVYRETRHTRSSAARREAQLKQLTRAEKLVLCRSHG